MNCYVIGGPKDLSYYIQHLNSGIFQRLMVGILYNLALSHMSPILEVINNDFCPCMNRFGENS